MFGKIYRKSGEDIDQLFTTFEMIKINKIA